MGKTSANSKEAPPAAAPRATRDERYAARAAALGLALGARGPCVLPGHRNHGGATEPRHGAWKYLCARIDRPFTFAEVRAVLAYADVPLPAKGEAELKGPWRRVRLPRDVEVSRWGERLDYEAGLRLPRDVPFVIPDDLPDAAGTVASAIKLMLGLRREDWEGWRFTWARRLSRAWTGLTDDRARAGLDVLRARRLILHVGQAKGWFGGPNMYVLSLLAAVGSETAMVQSFADSFDAEFLEEAA